MKTEGTDGFIIISRKITGWRWWHNSAARAIWIYLLVEANWSDGYLRDGTLIPRGSLARSLRSIAEACGTSVNTVRYWLNKFESTGEISKNTTHGYTVINVLNYGKYQDFEGDNHTPTDTPTDTLTDTPTDTVADTLTDTDITIKQENKKNNKTIKPLSIEGEPDGREILVDAADLQFQKFWDLYPRKVRKETAFEIFKSSVTDHEMFDRVMTALKSQLETTFANRQERYIPYPENWLAKKSWNDQPTQRERTFEDMLREEHAKNEQRRNSSAADDNPFGFPGFGKAK